MPQKNVTFQVVLDKEAVEAMIGFCYRSKTAQGFEKLTATDVEDAIENELQFRLKDFAYGVTKKDTLEKCRNKATELFPELYANECKKYRLWIGEDSCILFSEGGKVKLGELRATPNIEWYGDGPESMTIVPDIDYTESQVRTIMSFFGYEVPENFFTDGNN